MVFIRLRKVFGMKKIWFFLLIFFVLPSNASMASQPSEKIPGFDLNSTSFDSMELGSGFDSMELGPGGSTESMDMGFDLDSKSAEELYQNAVDLEVRNGPLDEIAILYYLSASKGFAEAQYRVGYTFFLAKEYNSAKPWLQKASNQGLIDAWLLLTKICKMLRQR